MTAFVVKKRTDREKGTHSRFGWIASHIFSRFCFVFRCGDGRGTVLLYNAVGRKGEVLASDLDNMAVKKAKNRLQKAKNVSFAVAGEYC